MSTIGEPAVPALVLELFAKSVLILAVVLSLTWFMRRSSAAARHLIFFVASVALVALPLAVVLLPSWHPQTVSDDLNAVFAPSSTHAPTPVSGSVLQPADRGTTAGGQTPVARWSWREWFFMVWFSGAVLLLLGLAAGKMYGYLTTKSARPVEDETFLNALEDVARRAGLHRPVPALESDRVKVPCIAGILHPKLLVPPQAVFWPHERLKAVVHHEFSHVRRNDILAQLFGQIACCLYWPNPLTWIAERMLFVERERACDDIVLGQDIPASDYAGFLMEVLEEMGNQRNVLWVTAAMADGTDFKDRILSVLNPAAKRTSTSPQHLWTAAIAVLLIVVPLSVVRPWTTDAAVEPAESVAVTTESGERTQFTDREVRRGSGEELTDSRGDTRDLSFTALVDLLSSESPRLRERAAVALGETGDSRAVNPLIGVLDDPDAGVREHAVTALGALEDERAVPPLCDLLLRDPHPVVREHAAAALGSIGDSRAVIPLCDALLQDRDPVVREHAATALGYIGDNRAHGALTDALQSDPSDEVREHALSALRLLAGNRR
jgi:beta-lactamase regulating signal transducer with metallopeptidase domain